jgi:hypothetical protein
MNYIDIAIWHFYNAEMHKTGLLAGVNRESELGSMWLALMLAADVGEI